MSKWMYAYRRVQQENAALKAQLQMIRDGKACINCIDMSNGTCEQCGITLTA